MSSGQHGSTGSPTFIDSVLKITIHINLSKTYIRPGSNFLALGIWDGIYCISESVKLQMSIERTATHARNSYSLP